MEDYKIMYVDLQRIMVDGQSIYTVITSCN